VNPQPCVVSVLNVWPHPVQKQSVKSKHLATPATTSWAKRFLFARNGAQFQPACTSCCDWIVSAGHPCWSRYWSTTHSDGPKLYVSGLPSPVMALLHAPSPTAAIGCQGSESYHWQTPGLTSCIAVGPVCCAGVISLVIVTPLRAATSILQSWLGALLGHRAVAR
jgi:hypothetical protein